LCVYTSIVMFRLFWLRIRRMEKFHDQWEIVELKFVCYLLVLTCCMMSHFRFKTERIVWYIIHLLDLATSNSWLELNCQIWFLLTTTITDLSFPFFFIEVEKLIQKTILFYRIDKFKLSFLTKDTNYHQISTSEIWYIGPISHENNNNVVLVLQMPSIGQCKKCIFETKSHKANRIPHKTCMKNLWFFHWYYRIVSSRLYSWYFIFHCKDSIFHSKT
jgi:hypothetical protein